MPVLDDDVLDELLSLFEQRPSHEWLQGDLYALAQHMRSSRFVMSEVTSKVQHELNSAGRQMSDVDACFMMHLLAQAGRSRLAMHVWNRVTGSNRASHTIPLDLYATALRACALGSLTREADTIFDAALQCMSHHSHSHSHSQQQGRGALAHATGGTPATSSRVGAGAGAGEPAGLGSVFAAMQLVLAMQGNVRGTYRIARMMMTDFGVEPGRSHRLLLLLAHARAKDVDGARKCFEDVVAPHDHDSDRAHRYMIEAHAAVGDVKGAEEAFCAMEAACTHFDPRCVVSLVKAYQVAQDPGGAGAALRRLVREYGITPPVKAFVAVVRAHAAAGDVEGAEDAIRLMKACGLNPTMTAFEFLIHAYLNSGDLVRARQVYSHVFRRHSAIAPTPLIHAAMLNHHMRAGDALGAAMVLLWAQAHGHVLGKHVDPDQLWEAAQAGVAALDGARTTQAAATAVVAAEGGEMDDMTSQGSAAHRQEGGSGQHVAKGQGGEHHHRRNQKNKKTKNKKKQLPSGGPERASAWQAQAERPLTDHERNQVIAMMRNHAWHHQTGRAASKREMEQPQPSQTEPRCTPDTAGAAGLRRVWCATCREYILPPVWGSGDVW